MKMFFIRIAAFFLKPVIDYILEEKMKTIESDDTFIENFEFCGYKLRK